ncbi:hypothetical protein V2I01_33490 [Micromonospora sp. BRA006-A]|nr:hypothetical protein [Micromonospora sp. BRA006-A]
MVAGLIGGGGLGVDLADFTDALAHEPQRRELMARVDVVGDERCDAIFRTSSRPCCGWSPATDGSGCRRCSPTGRAAASAQRRRTGGQVPHQRRRPAGGDRRPHHRGGPPAGPGPRRPRPDGPDQPPLNRARGATP